jgi:membrane protease YdiL (CAAX protease family)
MELLGVLMVHCILPAFCEEIVFRGWMFHALKATTSPWVGGLVTAVVFGLFHPWKSVIATASITLFSCCWTYANEDTDSLLPGIVSHFMHNFAMSVLTVINPDVCQTPKFMSLMLWMCGTVIVFLTVEGFREPTFPQGLAG